MNLKRLIVSYPFTFSALVFLLLFSIGTLFFSPVMAIIEFIIFCVLCALSFYAFHRDFKAIRNTVTAISEGFTAGENTTLNNFPLPVAVFDASDHIVWYNLRFKHDVLTDEIPKKRDIKLLTGGVGIETIREKQSFNTTIAGKDYTVYFSHIECAGRPSYALIFTEDTALKETARAYAMSKPAVAIIATDSADEIYRAYKENEYAQILGTIEQMTESWFSSYSVVFRKLSSGRFLAVMPESELLKMIDAKFNVMDAVRGYTYKDAQVGITLSIGVGRGESLSDAESNARQALDMALGRGGDQTALRNADGQYVFFGGVSKGLEKRTKVRTRVVAAAIEESLHAAENVLVMGHRFSDLDCIGAAAGIWQAANAMGKNVSIVVDEKSSMATELITYLKDEIGDCFVSPENAEKMVHDNTLLFLVDTHKASFSDSPALCEKAQNIIVIDHHRKTVDYLQRAVIFYHEPNASSACEMVTELLEYMGKKPIIKSATANALLAGIMLDTKEFTLRTGVRTFEAAAHLRSRGADTVTVKNFFSSTLEDKKKRGKIVLSAKNYRGCAIAVADFEDKDLRMLSSQAADELLTISEVYASFVLFKTGTTANISARSMGKINVQLVMESLSGGGHQTMAATQMADTDIDEAYDRLIEAIDDYLQNQSVK